MDQVTTSVRGAAKALCIGRTTIYTLLRQGQLTAIKVGRRRLILIDSIARLIETRRTGEGT